MCLFIYNILISEYFLLFKYIITILIKVNNLKDIIIYTVSNFNNKINKL